MSFILPFGERGREVSDEGMWLGIALVLTITNTLAFSRADKFSQASSFANRALSGGIAGNLASGLWGRLFG